MKKFVLTVVLLIILGFIFYQIINVILGSIIAVGIMFAILPMGFGIVLRYLFYVIGAIILLLIVKWAISDNK